MSIWKRILLMVMQTREWRWLLINVLPYIRFSMYYTKFKGDEYLKAYALLEPGDIILTIDKKKLTTLLVPGTYTHAAFCVGKYDKSNYPGFEVAEMTHDDYTKSAFFDVCKESDAICILRPRVSESYKETMISRCLAMQNSKYDVEFKLGVEALACSEMIYYTDQPDDLLGFDLADMAGLGRPYLSPDGIRACESLDVIFETW